jgi:hypothetical protein
VADPQIGDEMVGRRVTGQRGRWVAALPWLFAVILTAACAGGWLPRRADRRCTAMTELGGQNTVDPLPAGKDRRPSDDHVWIPDRAISDEGVITRVLNCGRCHLTWWPWESNPFRRCHDLEG